VRAVERVCERGVRGTDRSRMPPTTYDCMTCGACCCNPDLNRKYGHVNYIEIQADDRILRNESLVKKLVFRDKDDVPHVRLDRRQRCTALRGHVGVSVACSIYRDRPTGCRNVLPGDEECLRARRERGIDPA
jgi:Fe-S-cluster containining protein